jgi:hypothetical protein
MRSMFNVVKGLTFLLRIRLLARHIAGKYWLELSMGCDVSCLFARNSFVGG